MGTRVELCKVTPAETHKPQSQRTFPPPELAGTMGTETSGSPPIWQVSSLPSQECQRRSERGPDLDSRSQGVAPDRKSLLNRARRKITDNSVTPLFTAPLSPCYTNCTTATMGVSWQSPIQKAFIEGYVASYTHHSGNGTLKTEFWPVFFEKWFEAWPVPTPGPDFPGGEEAARNVMKEVRCKRIAVSTVYCRDGLT